MAIKDIIFLLVETPSKFVTAKLSILKAGSSSVVIIYATYSIHTSFQLSLARVI